MLNSVAQRLAAGGIDRDQAEVIADAIRQAVEQGDYVTSDQFKTGMAELRAEIASLDTRLSKQIAELHAEMQTQVAELRTEIASLETRLVRWMVGTVIPVQAHLSLEETVRDGAESPRAMLRAAGRCAAASGRGRSAGFEGAGGPAALRAGVSG